MELAALTIDDHTEVWKGKVFHDLSPVAVGDDISAQCRIDSAGKLVRAYASSGATSLPYKVNVPGFWLAPPELLPKNAGINRFVWDLRYPDPEQLLYTYYGIHVNYFEYTLADHAIPHETPRQQPQGPLVVPGNYTLELTVDGQTYKQPLTV